MGEKFEVDFEHVYLNSKKLVAARLGYKVRHKSMFKGQRDPSPIWRYGVELEYLEDNMSTARLWLCKKCHLNCEVNDAKAICGNRHIVDHMKAVHRIDPFTGLMPETPSTPRFSTPFEAAKAAGSGTVISHSPWQEEALQSAVIDWLIEAIQLQKNWVQRGIVKSPLKELAVYVENVDKKRVVPVANSNASRSVNTSFNSQPGDNFELLDQSEDSY
jgi:hypothetical protein